MTETSVSCNFFPSNISTDAIKNSYTIWKEKVKLAGEIIRKTPLTIGTVKTTWKSDIITHSIFDL